MKLKKLIKDLPISQVKGSKDLDITGVCANSKLVAPGNLFIARKGHTEDGTAFIPEALAAGAVAVLTDIYDPLIKHEVTQLIYPDVASIEGLLSAHYYQFPSAELFMVGLTGTNGKTTTSFLVKHLLDSVESNCGLIGTIEYIIGQHRYQATRTTPDVSTNQKMLREMVLQGCQSAVMEVTSHALDQRRVDNIDFDVAIFTNLTLDHLDYHHTMEAYAAAKNKLFTSLNHSRKKSHSYPKTAIVNIDNPWYFRMLEGCQANVLTYGLSSNADLSAKGITLTSKGTTLTLSYQGQQVPLRWPLVGQFNAYNCLAATAVGLVRGIPLKDIAEIMSSAPSVPGRLEIVPNALDLKIYVDFAHTDNALANVLESLQELKTGRIIVVFGCGGDRDVTKRPKMAHVCEQFADIVIVTSDNPRSENPEEIIRQINQGFTKKDDYLIEIDRSNAIEKAIDIANPDDIILIAGKGHEPYQIFAHKTIEFDDRKVAAGICHKKAALLPTKS